MEDQRRIAKHNQEWRNQFIETGLKLRKSIGQLAVRIDHVGSTSVIGLDAKPIIDIQNSVLDFEDVLAYRDKIEVKRSRQDEEIFSRSSGNKKNTYSRKATRQFFRTNHITF